MLLIHTKNNNGALLTIKEKQFTIYWLGAILVRNFYNKFVYTEIKYNVIDIYYASILKWQGSYFTKGQ